MNAVEIRNLHQRSHPNILALRTNDLCAAHGTGLRRRVREIEAAFRAFSNGRHTGRLQHGGVALTIDRGNGSPSRAGR